MAEALGDDWIDIFDRHDHLNLERRIAWAEACKQAARYPLPGCAVCQSEFRYGEAPALLFCTRATDENSAFFGGSICAACASQPRATLRAAIAGRLSEALDAMGA